MTTAWFHATQLIEQLLQWQSSNWTLLFWKNSSSIDKSIFTLQQETLVHAKTPNLERWKHWNETELASKRPQESLNNFKEILWLSTSGNDVTSWALHFPVRPRQFCPSNCAPKLQPTTKWKTEPHASSFNYNSFFLSCYNHLDWHSRSDDVVSPAEAQSAALLNKCHFLLLRCL